jgi:hypothetical protein
MSSSSVAIIGFASLLLIVFGIFIYRYYKNKNEGGPNDPFIFNFTIQEDKTNEFEYAVVKELKLIRKPMTYGGFRYDDQFTGRFIFNMIMDVSEKLNGKRLKIVHTDNYDKENTREALINGTEVEISIPVMEQSKDARGLHIFEIYVDDLYYGIKIFNITNTETNFSQFSNSYKLEPETFIDGESFSYELEYSRIPISSIKPVSSRSTLQNGILSKVRIISAGYDGAVKLQSDVNDVMFLNIFSTNDGMIAQFTESTVEDASKFYFHNISEPYDKYNDGTVVDYLQKYIFPTKNVVKIGNRDNGVDCYFLNSIPRAESADMIPMTRWIDIRPQPERLRPEQLTGLLFSLEDVTP